MDLYYGFGFFNTMSAILPVFFLVVVGLMVFVLVKGISTWNLNNRQPVVPAPAKVVDKRSHISRHKDHTANGFAHMHNHTSYYITFEFENGHRSEYMVPFEEYGVFVVGDEGVLTFQGTRFIGFVRRED